MKKLFTFFRILEIRQNLKFTFLSKTKLTNTEVGDLAPRNFIPPQALQFFRYYSPLCSSALRTEYSTMNVQLFQLYQLL